TRQQWIAGALAAMAGALAAIAWLPANPIGAALWTALAIYCIASATQDIAIDAYTIGLVDRANLGPANAVRTAAYRVGMLVATAGLLLLPDRFGWDAVFFTGAALSLLGAASLVATPAVALPPAAERRPLEALARWGRRRGALSVVAF